MTNTRLRNFVALALFVVLAAGVRLPDDDLPNDDEVDALKSSTKTDAILDDTPEAQQLLNSKLGALASAGLMELTDVGLGADMPTPQPDLPILSATALLNLETPLTKEEEAQLQADEASLGLHRDYAGRPVATAAAAEHTQESSLAAANTAEPAAIEMVVLPTQGLPSPAKAPERNQQMLSAQIASAYQNRAASVKAKKARLAQLMQQTAQLMQQTDCTMSAAEVAEATPSIQLPSTEKVVFPTQTPKSLKVAQQMLQQEEDAQTISARAARRDFGGEVAQETLAQLLPEEAVFHSDTLADARAADMSALPAQNALISLQEDAGVKREEAVPAMLQQQRTSLPEEASWTANLAQNTAPTFHRAKHGAKDSAVTSVFDFDQLRLDLDKDSKTLAARVQNLNAQAKTNVMGPGGEDQEAKWVEGVNKATASADAAMSELRQMLQEA